ncbi:MAG: TonB-dependent receptor domain-containing protein [Imperialibacter sp.]|uniref:TonB-dependent receptor n=1 Tax=Imperialibacter sp. TaxID=2038411 RepID=UPI003A87F212
MRRLILSCLLTSLVLVSYAQILTIKDKENNEPLELVTLYSEAPRATAMTNSSGMVDISEFEGADRIEVRLVGYNRIVSSYAELAAGDRVLVMEPSNISLDQVVVSASKWSQSTRDVPVHIATITPKDAALLNPQTAADLLGASGQVFIQKSQQGGGSPMIRGFATNRLLLTVDGVRMNTAIFRGGNLQNVISLDPFATENTEVFFGPGSVIYGSDAIGGVMSFTTLTPHLSLTDETLTKGSAATRFSSANSEKTAHLDFNVGWKKWSSVTSFSYNDYGDLRMGTKGPDDYLRPFYVQRIDSVDRVVTNDNPLVQRPSGYQQTNMMQKVRFVPNKRWDIVYAFHYSETSDYARYDRHIRYKNGLPRYGEWSYGPQKWMMNNLTTSYTANTGLFDQVTLRLAHQFFEESRIDRDINGSTRAIRIEKVNAYSANLDFSKSLVAGQKLYYGLEMIYDKVDSEGINEDISTGEKVVGPARYPQSDWSSYAAYATYQNRLSDLLLVQAGGRYNSFGLNATFDNSFYPFPFSTADLNNGALTGSAGVVLTPGEKLSISANLSTGFRSPNVDDVGKVFDSEPGAVVVPNPDLEAEYAYNAEVGMAKVFGDFLKLDATAFYTVLSNALVRRDFTLNGLDSIVYDGELSQVQAIQNAARATVYGFQAGLEVKLPEGFTVSSRYNVQVGEEELDDGSKSPSRHAAPAFGVSHFMYGVKNLKLDFYAQYSGGVGFADMPEEEKGKTEIYAADKEGNTYSPSWYTLNFKVSQKISDDIIISGGIENLTDQRYKPYSSGMAGAGRNFIISLRTSF